MKSTKRLAIEKRRKRMSKYEEPVGGWPDMSDNTLEAWGRIIMSKTVEGDDIVEMSIRVRVYEVPTTALVGAGADKTTWCAVVPCWNGGAPWYIYADTKEYLLQKLRERFSEVPPRLSHVIVRGD